MRDCSFIGAALLAIACAAGVQALETNGPVPVEVPQTPAFYADATA